MMWGNKKDQHQRTKKGRVTYQRSDDEIDGIARDAICNDQIGKKSGQTGDQQLNGRGGGGEREREGRKGRNSQKIKSDEKPGKFSYQTVVTRT